MGRKEKWNKKDKGVKSRNPTATRYIGWQHCVHKKHQMAHSSYLWGSRYNYNYQNLLGSLVIWCISIVLIILRDIEIWRSFLTKSFMWGCICTSVLGFQQNNLCIWGRYNVYRGSKKIKAKIFGIKKLFKLPSCSCCNAYS